MLEWVSLVDFEMGVMTTKIDEAIVGYSIKKPAEESQAVMDETVERPDELRGYTYKIKTPLSDHAIYITINNLVLNEGTEHEQEHPFEVFINSKNMEQFQWILALTRVVSAVFRKGGDATFLVDEFKQVFDPQGGYFKKGGRYMPSLVAEIGEVFETHMKKSGLIREEELGDAHLALIAEKKNAMEVDDSTEFPHGAKLCGKCNVVAAVLMDGCMTCLNCGVSKCG